MKLILPLLLLSTCVNAQQIKIGNISIDSVTAVKYFSDLYLHPDTVKSKSASDFLGCNGCNTTIDDYNRARERADYFNEQLEKYNIGQALDTVYYKESYDTLWDGILKVNYDYKYKPKKVTIEYVPAGSYISWKGYLMPRKPSEQDFIKWINANK